MKHKILCFVALLFLVPVLAYGAVAIQDDGTYEGEAAKVNFSGDFDVTFAQDLATVTYTPADDAVEVTTASADTVVAGDDNTTFIATYAGTTVYTLPTAASGLRFRFAAGVGQTVTIDTASTADTIQYLYLDAGDTIDSAGATGDSVELIGATGKWYVVDMGSSAWTDGGAS